MKPTNEIAWSDFEKVVLCSGTVIDVKEFPEARKHAYIITVDFGESIGIKKSSAQITDLYSKEELLNKQIIGVVNFPPKQIGPIKSEFLITGLIQDDGSVVLAVPDKAVANGLRLG
ncbi:MAG: tRNA-binding protein [Bacteroidetes bacterium]|jgi:tRNA-binding protein|nr:tRNA-binding protein [Bacteroidota bacterium]|tara:strand:+ start:84 stop:431 length:348 start_codon:yes stop_codon:yes gene_type:complete